MDRQLGNMLAEPLYGHPTYEKVRQISKSDKHVVQLARNRQTGELVAIKFTPRGWGTVRPEDTKNILREILNHQELSLAKHPHIVEFKEVFLTSGYLCKVTHAHIFLLCTCAHARIIITTNSA